MIRDNGLIRYLTANLTDCLLFDQYQITDVDISNEAFDILLIDQIIETCETDQYVIRKFLKHLDNELTKDNILNIIFENYYQDYIDDYYEIWSIREIQSFIKNLITRYCENTQSTIDFRDLDDYFASSSITIEPDFNQISELLLNDISEYILEQCNQHVINVNDAISNKIIIRQLIDNDHLEWYTLEELFEESDVAYDSVETLKLSSSYHNFVKFVESQLKSISSENTLTEELTENHLEINQFMKNLINHEQAKEEFFNQFSDYFISKDNYVLIER